MLKFLIDLWLTSNYRLIAFFVIIEDLECWRGIYKPYQGDKCGCNTLLCCLMWFLHMWTKITVGKWSLCYFRSKIGRLRILVWKYSDGISSNKENYAGAFSDFTSRRSLGWLVRGRKMGLFLDRQFWDESLTQLAWRCGCVCVRQRHRTERQCPCVFESLSGSERERILVSSENEMQVSIEQKTMLSLLREGFNHIWWLLSSYLHATLIDLISALYRHASFSIANNIIIPFSLVSSFITKINLKVTSYFI